MSGRPVDVSRAIARKRIQSRVGRGAEGIKAFREALHPVACGFYTNPLTSVELKAISRNDSANVTAVESR